MFMLLSHPGCRPKRVLCALLAVVAAFAMTATPAGAARRPATTTPPPVADPAGPIVFAAQHGGTQQIYRMNPDGTGKTQITFNKTGDKKCDPMLSPTGTEVVYASNDGGIYVNTIGSSVTVKNVAPAPDAGFGQGAGRRPAWSPDGNTIVFGYSTNYNDGLAPEAEWKFDLFMVSRPVGGSWGETKRITDVALGASAFQPRFNPADGKWISYTYRVGGPGADADLYVADVTTAPAPPVLRKPLGQLLKAGANGYLSSWSADGKKIGFVKSCTGGIHVVDVWLEVNGWNAGEASVVVASGGCGFSFSRAVASRFTYQADSTIYVVDLAGTPPTPVSIGIGSQPSW